ncbi:MAG TPA: response regulator, partial [Candidatus Hodarchaeales archaeon]|nr:response regulator [Candidatus Hodarchaeales archaeon]
MTGSSAKSVSHILLVEDNVDLIQIAKFSLEGSRYTLDAATSGHEAIEKLSNSSYDVIFLDYRLPDADGLEILRKIRKIQDQTGSYAPIYIITGGGSEQIAIESLRNGAFDYIVKDGEYHTLIPKLLEDLEEYYSGRFDIRELHLIVFKKGQKGPEVYCSTPNLPFRRQPDVILTKTALSLYVLVGMGESYNEGLFGPVPLPDRLPFSALVYA